jgi:hypothetical protein
MAHGSLNNVLINVVSSKNWEWLGQIPAQSGMPVLRDNRYAAKGNKYIITKVDYGVNTLVVVPSGNTDVTQSVYATDVSILDTDAATLYNWPSGTNASLAGHKGLATRSGGNIPGGGFLNPGGTYTKYS